MAKHDDQSRHCLGPLRRRCVCVRIPHPPQRGQQAMSDKRRVWFQIHLSTAIVLMFVGGGLLWLNVQGKFAIGWPLQFYLSHSSYLKVTFSEFQPVPIDLADKWWYSRLFADFAADLAILTAVAFA